jgi:serine protease Do
MAMYLRSHLPWLYACVLSCAVAAPTLAQPAPEPAPAQALAGAEAVQAAFTQVAERVSASVVAIRVEQRRKVRMRGFPFGEWFGGGEGTEQYQVERGTGSGVVIRKDGHILTNRHVVENASRVEVVFRDGRKLRGKTVGVDTATDLAVVKVDARDLRAATLGDSSQARPGEWVVAIGSPFGLDYTVTVGVVSAVGRGGMGANEIEDYLQTDASINPGNSGGPLVNLRGEVLGINTMIVGQGTGIGFAITSNMAKLVADQLIESGSVHRAFIGVTFQDVTPELAHHFGVEGQSGGALVNAVLEGGPAAKAGLEPGDVILSIDGKPIGESRQLQRIVLERAVGAKLSLVVVREKKERTLTLVTGERPLAGREGEGRAEPKEDSSDEPATGGFGMRLLQLTAAAAKQLGLEPSVRGALVAEVARGSIAERAGLSRGDLIVEADRKPVRDPNDVNEAAKDGAVVLRVRRGVSAHYVVLSRDP